MPAGKEVQPECISQRASSGRLNCSCSRSRDLTAINPVVPEMMKIAALAVSTAPGGNMSFAFSKSVPIAPAKGRGKRTPAWTNRRAKALVPCGFADAKTAKGILQYQNSRKRLSNCPRIPREEVRKYGSFQSGAKYGIYRYEQPPLAKQGIVLKGKGLVVANAFAARRLGLYPCGLIPYQPGEDRRNPRSGKGTRKSRIYRAQPGARRKGTLAGRRLRHIRAAAAARAGSSYQRRTAAMCAILKHYEGYIAKLCTRTLKDDAGNTYSYVDEEMRNRLQVRLITRTLAFHVG